MILQLLFQNVIGIAAIGFASGLMVGLVIVFLLRRMRALKRIAPQFTTRFMYSGNLKQTNLLDAIQFLELGRREGILHIYVGRRKGYIAFVNGRIVDAFFRNTTGKEGIFLMLELDYGDFYFESKTLNQPPVITESIMDIALEWDARKYDVHAGGGGDGSWQDGGEGENVPPADGVVDASQDIPDALGQGYDYTQQGEVPENDAFRREEGEGPMP
ncbi:MAG: DUF4388 domain-containing protein [Chitinispirillaceae bacterium]|nr:DUF4388 domain-containing protein [Chitinispirillaceae bacterium]